MSGAKETWRQQIVVKKEKKLRAIENKLLQLNGDIKEKNKQLLVVQEQAKHARIAHVRHATHLLTTTMDLSLRPPDQSNDIRTYSKMDLDIWKHDDVRHWFNKDAVGHPDDYAYKLTPADTGYVVKL